MRKSREELYMLAGVVVLGNIGNIDRDVDELTADDANMFEPATGNPLVVALFLSFKHIYK